MSEPNGFMIKGVAYPVRSIRLEMAMSVYIKELEQKLKETEALLQQELDERYGGEGEK